MQTTLFRFGRHPLAAGAFCLALAAVVTGCASKNPLMEEPTPVASTKPAEPEKQTETAAPQAAAEEKPAEAAPAPVAAEQVPASATTADAPQSVTAVPESATTSAAPAAMAGTAAAAEATSGVQTVKPKRFLGFLRPYRPDVQQGNFVSREMVAQLKPGMTQDQVVFLLGTPLLTDIFHADRWDYAFRLQKGNGEITTSRVTVYFKDKLVSHFEGGGDLPTEADYLARIANKAKEAKNK